jgi:hypothetical protein
MFCRNPSKKAKAKKKGGKSEVCTSLKAQKSAF